jgi:hypothetical protein
MLRPVGRWNVHERASLGAVLTTLVLAAWLPDQHYSYLQRKVLLGIPVLAAFVGIKVRTRTRRHQFHKRRAVGPMDPVYALDEYFLDAPTSAASTLLVTSRWFFPDDCQHNLDLLALALRKLNCDQRRQLDPIIAAFERGAESI